MSFVKDVLFGQEGTPATVQDTRSDTLSGLGDKTSNVFGGIVDRTNPNFLNTTSGLPTAAGVTNPESDILSSIQSALGLNTPQGNQLTGGAQDQLMRILGGGSTSDIVGAGMPAATGLVQDVLSGRTMDPASNPALQASIQAAQQPLIDLFGDQMGDLRGQFTRAGQFTAPGASSPFEREQARLQTGLAQALGNVGTNLVADNLNQERNRQTQILNTLQNAFESGESRRANAATSAPGFTSTQLTGLIQGLEASALPRLVEQYGIDEGQRRFEQQQNQLLTALTNAFGVSNTPQNVSVPGQEGTTGLIGPLATAVAGPVGGAIGEGIAGIFK